MWNRRDCRASKMNHHQPQQRPVFIQRKWWWDWNEVPCCELFPESSTIPTHTVPNQQCQHVLLPIRPTERSRQQKASRISQQKMYNLPSGFHKTDWLQWLDKSCYCSNGKLWFICYIHQILYLWCPLISVFTKFS